MERLKLRKRRKSSLARMSGATRLFVVIAVISFVLALIMVFTTSDALQLLFQVIALGSVFGSVLAFTAGLKESQKQRDAEASQPGPIAFYLRTFYSDQKLWLFNPFYTTYFFLPFLFLGPFGVIFLFIEARALRAEAFVARILEPYIRVLQVSGGDKTYGGPRIAADESNWRGIVADTVEKADFIVVLPLLSQQGQTVSGHSTLWEISHLLERGKMEKAVVLMPHGYPFRTDGLRKSWALAQQHAHEIGLALPDYDPAGCILTFRFDAAGGVWREAARYGAEGSRKKRFAQGLLDALQARAAQQRLTLLDPERA